jgi:hypothetical protein
MESRDGALFVMTARWPQVALGSMLGLGGIGLILGAVWIAGIPTLACTEGMTVGGWVYFGFILFALGLPASVIWGTLQLHEGVHRYYVAAAVGEGVISLVLALYLGSKYGHYQCGWNKTAVGVIPEHCPGERLPFRR